MACGYGLLAEDCAADHWCPPLGGRREAREWRAPCPLCKASRSLEFDVKGRSIRWNSFCADHDRDTLRPVLRNLLGDCLPGRSRSRPPIDHDDLIALLLSGLPPQSMRLAGLQMAGMGTAEALDKLGVRREHRSRVIDARTRFGAKPQVGTRADPGAGKDG